MVMIQIEEIKQYFEKKINTTEKRNRDLQANLGTVLPVNPELTGECGSGIF